MRTYKLYGTALTSNSANITIQRTGRIRSIRWAVYADLDADAEAVIVELSTQAVGQPTTNDSIGDIDQIRVGYYATAAADALVGINVQRIVDYPVGEGERVYLNATGSAATLNCACFIDVEEGR